MHAEPVGASRRFGAKLGSAVLLVCLVLLAAANFIGAPLWAVTLAAAVALVRTYLSSTCHCSCLFASKNLASKNCVCHGLVAAAKSDRFNMPSTSYD